MCRQHGGGGRHDHEPVEADLWFTEETESAQEPIPVGRCKPAVRLMKIFHSERTEIDVMLTIYYHWFD